MSTNIVSLSVTGGAWPHPRMSSAAGHDQASANHIADRGQAANQSRPILDIRGAKGLYRRHNQTIDDLGSYLLA